MLTDGTAIATAGSRKTRPKTRPWTIFSAMTSMMYFIASPLCAQDVPDVSCINGYPMDLLTHGRAPGRAARRGRRVPGEVPQTVRGSARDDQGATARGAARLERSRLDLDRGRGAAVE